MLTATPPGSGLRPRAEDASIPHMCGNAGILRFGERPLPPRATLERMQRALAPRGSDERGLFVGKDFALVTTRLPVRAPSGGHAENKKVRHGRSSFPSLHFARSGASSP